MTDTTICPADELLISYANGELSDAEQLRLEGHLDACDRCLESLCSVHTRLQATAADLEPTPAALVERARAAWDEEPRLNEGDGEARRPRPAAPRATVPMLLRLPILIPVSLAAGALLVVATRTWLTPAQQPILIRSVQILQITQEVVVRTQPRAGAAPIAKLLAGDMVEVRGTQPGWDRIALPDGGEGWIEHRALE